MRARLWAPIAGFALAGSIVPMSAMADVDWSGAGWYLSDIHTDVMGVFISGPYSSEADCKTALSALPQDQQSDSGCNYFASDPDKN